MRNYSILLVALLFIVSGCTTSAFTRGETDLHRPDFSQLAKMKKGKVCAEIWFSYFIVGSELVSEAAQSADIKTVELVEESLSGIAGIHQNHCTIVYGK